MLVVFASLAALSLAALVVAFVWAARERGRVTRRSGPEVHAEIVSKQIDRDARLEGKSVLGKKVWAGGTGAEIGFEAKYSTDELVRAHRAGNLRPVAPGLLLLVSLLGLLLFGGLTLLALPGVAKLFGLALVGIATYGTYLISSGLRDAARKLDSETGAGTEPR
ncbi:MAG: hypothetical protein KDB94_13035 [Acidobacteria bacterium]|nr:hypothetical protein [Acidobacteriota bacterium]MCB9378225.1 hypothetical protein [Holophagales bacterium]